MSNFLGSPAVTLAYYLFTLFGIEAALVIAWGQWRRSDSFRARRLTIVFGGLTILRIMLLFLALVGNSAPEIESVWIPPFERVLAISSLGFLLWGFTPLFREKTFLGNTLLALNTAFAFIFYFVTVIFWMGSDFNQTPWDVFFGIWLAILAIFGMANCASKLDDERTYALYGFGTLLAGYIAHIFFASSYSLPHIPVWSRVAELIAYPIFAVAVYHGAIQSLSARSQELQNLSKVSLDQIRGLISLFEATQQISSSLELASVLDGAAESVANAVGADQSAIALPEDEDDMSQLRLVSIYNPSRKGRGESVTFPLNEQQVIKHALKRKSQVQIDEYQDNNQIRMLFAVMGAKDIGPLLVQPLLKEDEPIGVLIVGNADSKRVFTESEAHLCKILANQITVSIDHAKEYMSASSKAQHLSWTLRNQEMEASKRRAAMETELKKSREEVILFAQRLQEFEVEAETNKKALKQLQERAAKLDSTIGRAKIELEKSKQKEKQFESLGNEAQTYKKHLAELQVEHKHLLEQVEELEQEAGQLDRLNQALETSNQRSRKLARALKRARALNQQAAPVPAALSSAEVNAKLEDLSCGVIIGDANDKINRVNAAATHMLSCHDNKLINKDLASIFEDKHWQEALQQLKATNEPMVTTTLKVGETVLRATVSPMASEGNGREGTVTILYDITAEAESQQARDEFVASLSQELRTPMTSITGYTDLLLGESVGTIGEMQRKFLQRIKANIERMGSMLNDLIGVTAIDAGQLEIRPVVIDMAEIIEDALINARAQLEEKEITLNVRLIEDMPLVEVDLDSMRQIISNLLGNAIKATPVGGTIEVSSSMYEVRDTESPTGEPLPFLRVSIRDSGGGIAEKDIDRVFERFYRAERPLIEGLGETGVGLAIVKSLIEAHGGRVWVESEIGDSATFHFILAVNEQLNDPWLEVDIPPLDLNSDQSDSF